MTELKAVVGGNDERAMEEKELIVIIEDEAPESLGRRALHSPAKKHTTRKTCRDSDKHSQR